MGTAAACTAAKRTKVKAVAILKNIKTPVFKTVNKKYIPKHKQIMFLFIIT
jgi:hypothetical protein